jgi:hypothetical protein
VSMMHETYGEGQEKVVQSETVPLNNVNEFMKIETVSLLARRHINCCEAASMRVFILSCSLTFLILSASHTTALSAEPDGGKAFYMRHCSSCHGQEGHGNGPVSRYLNVKVPDLTLLKRKNKGIYPLDKVIWAIDGRRDVRAHGDRQMPVWGEIFTTEERKYPERTSALKAKLIAEYIGMLQQ